MPLEARPFLRWARGHPQVRVAITGVGPENAARCVRDRLGQVQPDWAITAGFAGALSPAGAVGDLLYETGEPCPWESRLRQAGARAARFHSCPRIVPTAGEKLALGAATGADAVEMESGAIRAACQDQGVPCLTLRIVSDASGEDLPLDFNRFFTADYRLNPARVAAALLRRPQAALALFRLRRRMAGLAVRLSGALQAIVALGS
jgi:adenosylhomocysteine nucleosidase